MRKVNVIVVLLLVVVSVPITHGQDNKLLKVLESVEEKQRSSMAERLKLFIEYHRTGRWERLYKLIEKGDAGRKSAGEFARETAGMKQFDFVPERAVVGDAPYYNMYYIEGCVETRPTEKETVWLPGGLVAHLQSGEWNFTRYYLLFAPTVEARRRCESLPHRSN